MAYIKHITYLFLALLSASLLVSCQDGSDANSTGGSRGGSQNGFLSLGITDAPIDGAAEVWVQFDGVTLKPQASNPFTIPFTPPMSINLLALQGQNSVQMLTNEILPTGVYEYLVLNVSATNDGILDSYIKLNDGLEFELDIPSGSESGLKIIGGLEIIANTSTNMTIDFDLRKSIVFLAGASEYMLKPVLKLVKDAETGTISGTVNPSTLVGSSCSDEFPSTFNAIYLYDNFNVTPDDIDNIDPEPVGSAVVTLNDATGEYEYSFGFIPLGKYTAVFTCQANLDDPETDDTIVFSNTRNVNLTNTTTLPPNTFR